MNAQREKELLESVRGQLFIDGSWRAASSSATFAVEDPSTGTAIKDVADASSQDVRDAVRAASESFSDWAHRPPRFRSDILRHTFDLVMERKKEFALLMTLEMGKPLQQSEAEVAYGADFLRWFSEEAVRIHGRYYPAPDGSSRIVTMKQPVGPVYMITPWNFPLAMATRKIAPALAAGCTVVIKPAGLTPLTTLYFAQALEEAGVPKGVMNVITTRSSGQMSDLVLNDPRIRKLSFTGSTEVGKELVAKSANNLLRVSMELGGNAPFIVFGDADLDLAIEGAMIAKMRNMGEACTSVNRFLVESSVAGEFAERLEARFQELKVGRGTEEGIDVGPLINTAAVEKVSGLLEDAVSKGARTVFGGSPLEGSGYFFSPTVIDQVPSDAKMTKEEIFGPVAAVSTFDSTQDAIRMANDTEFGLVAYLFTQDLDRGLKVVESLETGMVGLNQGLVSNASAPFGGVKESGYGREGGFEGIEEYLSVKYAAIRSPS